jgi:hypothetical protein
MMGTLLACLAVAHTARAEDTLVANIPFAFIVDGETLPPGEYEIEVGPGHAQPVLTIQSAEPMGQDNEYRFVAVLTTPGDLSAVSGKPRLVFTKVGNHNFLAKVNPRDGTAVRKVR